MATTSSLPPGLAAPIPFYVTPYYNSKGPAINVGPLSEALALATPATIGVLVETWRPALAYQPATTLFVLAVRLFDLGQHDEGLYWFYQAQYRARRLHRLLDPTQIGQLFDPAFELESAHGAFLELAGPYFNGYAGCAQARWLGAIERVRADNQEVLILPSSTPAWPCAPPKNGRQISRQSMRAWLGWPRPCAQAGTRYRPSAAPMAPTRSSAARTSRGPARSVGGMAKDAKAQTHKRLPRGSEPVGHQQQVPAALTRLKVVTWPNGHPRVAQPAIQQGRHLAHNFRRFVQGDAFEFFAYFNKGDFAVMGRS